MRRPLKGALGGGVRWRARPVVDPALVESAHKRYNAFMGSLGSSELLIVLAVFLLVFGGRQLPKLARNLGQAQSEFRKGIDEIDTDEQSSV